MCCLLNHKDVCRILVVQSVSWIYPIDVFWLCRDSKGSVLYIPGRIICGQSLCGSVLGLESNGFHTSFSIIHTVFAAVVSQMVNAVVLRLDIEVEHQISGLQPDAGASGQVSGQTVIRKIDLSVAVQVVAFMVSAVSAGESEDADRSIPVNINAVVADIQMFLSPCRTGCPEIYIPWMPACLH